LNTEVISQISTCISSQNHTPQTLFDLINTSNKEFDDVEYMYYHQGNNVLEYLPTDSDGFIDYNAMSFSDNPNSDGVIYTTIGYAYYNWNSNFRLIALEFINIQTDSHLSFNIPANSCQATGFDIHNYTSHNIGTFSASNNSYLTGQNNDEVLIASNAQPSTFTINWESNTNGCTFTKSDNLEIKANPIITFPLVQTGQILDSDANPIPLTASTDIPASIAYSGPGVTNTNYIPSDGGNGLITLIATANTSSGCLSQKTQEITVTYDPGIPRAPYYTNFSSGFARMYTDGLTTGRNFTVNYESGHSFHLCDGQNVELLVDQNSIETGYDSIIIEYLKDNVTLNLGTHDPNAPINITIPETNGIRIDKLKSRFKSSIGTIGSSRINNIYVSVPNNRKLLDTVCNDENIFDTKGFDSNDFSHLVYSSPINSQTSNGFNILWDEYDALTIKTNILDQNSNFLFQVSSQNWTSPISNGSKTKTLIRKESTTLPNNDAITLLTYPCSQFGINGCIQLSTTGELVFNNIQTCESEDTLIIVELPIPNYNYFGDDSILGGTTVQLESVSTFQDWVSFDFHNGKGEQIGDTIIDTLYSNNGIVTMTAYDNFGCSSDTVNHSFVVITNNPQIGLIDSTSSGSIYPVRNGEFTFSGHTDSLAMEMHICDGQTIDLSIDSSRLAFNNGIDSVYYLYYSNGIIDTIGKYGIFENVSYVTPKTTLKRVDSVTSQLITVIGEKGDYKTSPIFVSTPLQREPTTQILNCNELFTVNTNEFIGQNNSDYQGLQNFVLNSVPADPSTFTTQFRDINDNLIIYGTSFSHTLSAGNKIDTLFRKEITYLPYKGSGFNYFSKIGNPQSCELKDTILVVRPPLSSYIFQGVNQIIAGTSIRHISTSQFTDWVEWDFNDGSEIYSGDTMWHAIYDIGMNDISVKAYDIYGCADTLFDQAYIEVIDWTSVENNSEIISEIKSYPNPMKDILNLEIESKENIEVTLIIIDMQGKTIVNNNFSIVNSINTINLDVSELSRGLYTCKIIGVDINVSQKLIKQ
jgi:hypothetical protein